MFMLKTIRGRILFMLVAMSFAAGLGLLALEMMQQRELATAGAMRAGEFREQLERSVELFDATHASHTFDYTYWDEMVALVTSRDEAWAHANIDTSITTMGIAAAWVLNTSLDVAYATTKGLPTPDDKSLPASIDMGRLKADLQKNPFLHFFVTDARGLLEFRTAPIQPTADADRKTPAQGYYLTAKLWDKSYLDHLGGFLDCEVWTAGTEHNDHGHDGKTSDQVLVNILLPGLDGRPTSWLFARNDFKPIHEWQQYLHLQIVIYLLMSGILLASLYFVLTRMVSKPLGMVTRALRGDNTAINGLAATGTEFCAIAWLLNDNRMQRIALEDENQQRRRLQEELQLLADRDPLTGLANRSLFTQSLNQRISESILLGNKLAVFYIDLDRFKNINDMHGHPLGDQLLCIVAELLRNCVGSENLAARIGGDEFLLYVGPFGQIEEVLALAERLLRALSMPIRIDDNETFTAASIGISLFPEHGDDAGKLIAYADQAMYRVKQSGRNGYRLVDPELMNEEAVRLSIEAQLRRVLERNELHLLYQPRMDRRSGEIVAVEALLRWTHPERGNISPDVFIPMAEENGLIVPIGLWVLREACRQHVKWQDEGMGSFRVAVNLSAKQLRSSTLADDILAIIKETGIEPCSLELELTESALDTNHTATAAFMNSMAERGIRFAIDDFGVGYSSLSYLKDLPVHTLKIDRSFLRGAEINPAQSRLVAGITSLAHGLGLAVVAEGVENAEQMNLVSVHGCDELQGYLISRPLPAGEIAPFIVRVSERPAHLRIAVYRA
jgi:diguanylate cyclase (GGDEF)-like protein